MLKTIPEPVFLELSILGDASFNSLSKFCSQIVGRTDNRTGSSDCSRYWDSS